MTFDSESIEAAASALFGSNPSNCRSTVNLVLFTAIANMKKRGVDPCAEARREERDSDFKRKIMLDDPSYADLSARTTTIVVAKARREERERCARKALSYGGDDASDIADMIRALEDEK